MASIVFWVGWVVAWLLTALLFVWHLPFYPFCKPGASANEAAAAFLFVMIARWLLVAALVVIVAVLWAVRRRSAAWLRVAAPLAGLAAHSAAGVANGVIWNAWVGTPHHPEAVAAWALAGTYFAIPVIELLVLAAARLRVPRVAPGPRAGDRI